MSSEPFSFPLAVADVPAEGRHVRIEAGEAERRALAAVLDIPEIRALSADFDVSRGAGRALRLSGSIEAVVVQIDVVTLDLVEEAVHEAVDLTLLPAEGAGREGRRAPPPESSLQTDAPEYYRGGQVDLGVVAAEHLALGLDPYPRAPETEFSDHVEPVPEDDGSPFSVLSRLKGDGG